MIWLHLGIWWGYDCTSPLFARLVAPQNLCNRQPLCQFTLYRIFSHLLGLLSGGLCRRSVCRSHAHIRAWSLGSLSPWTLYLVMYPSDPLIHTHRKRPLAGNFVKTLCFQHMRRSANKRKLTQITKKEWNHGMCPVVTQHNRKAFEAVKQGKGTENRRQKNVDLRYSHRAFVAKGIPKKKSTLLFPAIS